MEQETAKKNKEYKSIDSYKPTGKLIYNNELIQKVQDKFTWKQEYYKCRGFLEFVILKIVNYEGSVGKFLNFFVFWKPIWKISKNGHFFCPLLPIYFLVFS